MNRCDFLSVQPIRPMKSASHSDLNIDQPSTICIIIAKCVYTYLHPPTHIRTHIFHRIKCSSRLHTNARKRTHIVQMFMIENGEKIFSLRIWWELKKTHRATIQFPLLIVGNVNTGLTQFSDFIFQTLDVLLCLCAFCTPNLSSFFFCYILFSSLRFRLGFPYVS